MTHHGVTRVGHRVLFIHLQVRVTVCLPSVEYPLWTDHWLSPVCSEALPLRFDSVTMASFHAFLTELATRFSPHSFRVIVQLNWSRTC